MRLVSKIALIALVLMLPRPAFAALAIDSQMGSATGVSGASPFTTSFTNTAGTLLVCGAVGANAASTITSVTYAGAAMTSAVTAISHNNTGAQIGLFYKLTPATGANNVVVTLNNAGVAVITGCISFTGNDTSTPIGNTASATSPSDSTTSSVGITNTAGNYIVDASCNGTSMGNSSQTLTWKLNVDNLEHCKNGASSYSTATGSVTMSYTGNGNDGWASVAVEVKAAAGGGAAPSRMLLLGCCDAEDRR